MSSTVAQPEVARPGDAIPRRRRLGVRLWLGLAFAGVGIITGTSVYVFVSGQSEESAEERSADIAVGRTVRVADQLEKVPASMSSDVLESYRSENYVAWVFDAKGRLLTPESVLGVELGDVSDSGEAVRQALEGGRFTGTLPKGVTVASVPVLREGRIGGAVLARATRPPEVRSALEAVREDRLKALAIAVGLAVLIGSFVASVITVRVKRLAASAAQIAEGRLGTPLEARGRDEIGDLGRALDSMRAALRESFDMLSTERDTLSAILDALSEAVIVVSAQGDVHFSNPAARPLIGTDGKPLEALGPWLRRAAQQGEAFSAGLRVGDRVYALHALELRAEDAVLLVVHDRTDELRKEVAEREFVSNAAHELRNPIAGISGAIEVLRAGAKDDPQALEHFLQRLTDDAERISRLSTSLLTLARIEAVGESETDVVDVQVAAGEAAQAVAPPEELRLEVEVEDGLLARGDPVLLRQVLISLLTNAYKSTSPGGVVGLRARGKGDEQVLIEVSDTGTGIPAEEQERIFERFYRGSDSLEKEGFGLGLAIARRMVEVMGGEIGVRSEVGRGSTFWVRLPIAKPAPTPVA